MRRGPQETIKYGTERNQFWKKGGALEIQKMQEETGLVLLFSILHGFLHWALRKKVDWSILKLWLDQHPSTPNLQETTLLIKYV